MNYYSIYQEYKTQWKPKKGVKLGCLPKRKLEKEFPDYNIVGETCKRNKKKKIGILRVSEKLELIVSKENSHNPIFFSKRKHLQVGPNDFIAIVRFRFLLFFLVGLLILGSIGYSLYQVANPEPVELLPDSNAVYVGTMGYACTGTVTYDAKPLEGATVTIYSGEKVLGQAVTDENGHFIFKNLPNGYYSFVVQYKDRIITRLLCIANQDTVMNIAIQVPKRNSIITDDDDNGFSGDGMQDNAEEDKNDATVELSLRQLDPETYEGLKEKFAGVAGDLYMAYYQSRYFKHFGDRTEEHFTSDKLITIAIPFNMGATYHYVFAEQGGKIVEFTQIQNKTEARENTFYVDKKNIVVYTKNFGLFAIGYMKDASVTKGGTEISYKTLVKINNTTKKASLYFYQSAEATASSIAELVIQQNGKEYVIARSGLIRPGYELKTLSLLKDAPVLKKGSYSGILRIRYDMDAGEDSDMNLEIPITISVE